MVVVATTELSARDAGSPPGGEIASKRDQRDKLTACVAADMPKINAPLWLVEL